jgi:penicillin-binding protein 2
MSKEIFFEEALADEWSGDYDVQEVPLDEKPLYQVGIFILLLATVVLGRIFFLNWSNGAFYVNRAEANLGRYERVAAARGVITDRYGTVLAENKAVFSGYLDIREFLRKEDLQNPTLKAMREILGISAEDAWNLIRSKNLEKSIEPLILKVDLSQRELVALKELDLPTLLVREGFRRDYPDGRMFSSVIGYIGLPTAKDLEKRPELSGEDFIGKAGVEAYYEDDLRGTPGLKVKLRDARGQELDEHERSAPESGKTLQLTLDADLQRYFYDRMSAALTALDRTGGIGMAMNPKTGEVLALVNFPVYDNNVFTLSGFGEERVSLLRDPKRPLFDRAISGVYSPGSTIKPLVGVAALAERIIGPERTIFSPGYLDIPNPYQPDKPTRFVDWRFQGEVDLGAALAQSSNVYFYEVGGGASGITGLGITRLRQWWQKFGLEEPTGIDMPGETTGFLPSPEWKERRFNRPWLLGDTYNVSIGQGDLQVTPIALLNYISAIANGGVFHRPVVNGSAERKILRDLSQYSYEIKEVQKGMLQAVEAKMGTAHTMNDLPFRVGGKTGSAQINNNANENAFFVGYAPYEDPEITILVMVEDAKQGSLNAVPIAKDVLNWYYGHRIAH